MTASLRLQVTDYQGLTRWRWVLSDAGGNFLADHEVQLDQGDIEYQGFTDLPRYLRRYAPATPRGELLQNLGVWLGAHVLGGLERELQARLDSPATVVDVILPAAAQELLFRPYELAHVGGQPLAAAGVRFLYAISPEELPPGARPAPAAKTPVGDCLRVLAVFSLPYDVTPLNLRRERYQLKRLVTSLVQTRGVAVELRSIQYGSTRKTLEDALQEGAGWDVIHFAGHGLAGELALEHPSGEMDLIGTEELIPLLRPTRRRVKLLTLSACLSGAATLEAARAQIGLDEPPQGVAEAAAGLEHTVLPSLAQRLSQELDCAALAMRYPVDDEFATNLALELYELLFVKGQPLPGALQLGLRESLREERSPIDPGYSMVTPILFGPRSADLVLRPPAKPPVFELPATGLIYFPPEPRRFVGRMMPMLRASQALAPESEKKGVLFYGMAGAGKTTCALELAYRHEHDRFVGYAWFKAPDEGNEIATSLSDLAISLEQQLPGLSLVGMTDDAQVFQGQMLPRLKALLTQRAILIALDNLESLLTSSGEWRDPKWGQLVETLLDHRGASRVVLTSRRLPASLQDHPALLREAVHALGFGESVSLARELPNLRPLFQSTEGQQLLQRTLSVVQGHPKLLEMADRMSARAADLTQQVAKSERQAARSEAQLQAFFQTGESGQQEDDFVRTLREWTSGLTATLPPTTRLLFQFLSRLEDDDRSDFILEINWPDMLKRISADEQAAAEIREPAAAALDLPGFGLAQGLESLAGIGLVEVVETQPAPEAEEPAEGDENAPGEDPAAAGPDYFYRIHPGVAEAVRFESDPTVLAAADIELGDFWLTWFGKGIESEMEGGGGLVVESGRRAAPYLLRSQRWEEAAILLEQVIQRDNSPSTLAMAIPLLRQIVEETKGTREGLENEVVLANTLQEAGRFGEAEESLRHVIEACLADGNYRLASSSGTHLLSLMISTGRLVNSLSLAKEVAGYTRQAGLGPWTQLSDESQRLQILAAMGKYEEVLEELSALEERMASITDEEEREETVKSWNVREGLLVIGCSAALGLERWETALELNAANVDIKIQRNADILEIARARFEDYFPLLRLGRIPEARELLDICKEVFEAVQAVRDIGGVYSALADLEDEDGHSQAAANFEQSALRYNYQGGIPEACASSHNNLSNYLRNIEASPTDVLAHRLAAALLRLQIRSGGLITTIKNLANLALPAERPSFDEVVASVEQVDGVRFRELFSRLPVHAPDGDAALELIWGLVEEELARRREEEQQQQKVLESMPEPVRAAFALDGEEFSAALEESLAGMDPEEAERVLAQLQESGLINRGAGGDAVLDERDQLQQFEPLLGAIAAVARGNPEGKPEIEAALNDLEEGGWHLKGPVERLWGGERDATSLIDGLDDQDTRLVLRMLELVALPSVEEQLAELPEPMRSALEAGDSEALQAAIDALPEEDAQAVIELLDRVFPSDEAEEEELDEAQILEELDPLLLAVAEVARGRDELREDVELALTELAEAGWLLTGAVRRIWAGERDARALTAEVDPGSAPLVLRILELLEKPSPDEVLAAMPPEVQAAFELDGDAFSAAFEAAMEALPPEQAQEILLALRDAGLVSGGPPPQDDLGELFERFDPLIEALVEIARGDESSRAEAETVLRDLEEKGWMLLEPARQIWAGERDAQKLTAGLDEQDKTLVLRALQKLSE